jgi:hypothetical protein
MWAMAVRCLDMTASAGWGRAVRDLPLPPGATQEDFRDASGQLRSVLEPGPTPGRYRLPAILGGQVYNDPEGTDSKLGAVGLSAMKGAIFTFHRAELARQHTLCTARGLTMRLAAIPPDHDPPLFQTYEFAPAHTRRLFGKGYTRAQECRAWDARPSDRDPGEDRPRPGTALPTPGRRHRGRCHSHKPLRVK